MLYILEWFILLLVLLRFVLGDKSSNSELLELIDIETNEDDPKESGLTLVSYIDMLDCGVEQQWKGNIFTESCGSLKEMGVNRTGLYILNNKSIAFCDMSKNSSHLNMYTQVGRIRYKDIM